MVCLLIGMPLGTPAQQNDPDGLQKPIAYISDGVVRHPDPDTTLGGHRLIAMQCASFVDGKNPPYTKHVVKEEYVVINIDNGDTLCPARLKHPCNTYVPKGTYAICKTSEPAFPELSMENKTGIPDLPLRYVQTSDGEILVLDKTKLHKKTSREQP